MIDSQEFIARVRPALEAQDAALLAQTVRVRWRASEVSRLLRCDDADVRRVAAVTLGLIGDMSVTPALTRALRDDDLQVNQMAEHGLWSIWFRSCQPTAAKPFRHGLALLNAEAYERAVDAFGQATRVDPRFAEAYNQCAIAHYFLSQWSQSMAECSRTVRLVPAHFGAIAGMGHCYAQLGDLGQSLRCYRRALRINPRMTAIARAIDRLEDQGDPVDASGEFEVDQLFN